MNKTILYEQVLKDLAASGIPEAAMALQITRNLPRDEEIPNKVGLVQDLKNVVASLTHALKANDIEWTRDTDTHINTAINSATSALGKLAN